MKTKPNLIMTQVEDDYILVPVGDGDQHGAFKRKLRAGRLLRQEERAAPVL